MAKPPVASILIVEDNEELLEILGFVLEDAGYKVIGVSDGAYAIALIDTQLLSSANDATGVNKPCEPTEMQVRWIS